MTKASHIIKKQVLETSVSSKKDAWRLQNELKDIYYSEIVGAIETVCNEVQQAQNKTLALDKVVLDVGVIHANDIGRSWTARVINLLRTQIKDTVANSTDSHAPKLSFRDRQESDIELLKFFLLHGTMPWWGQTLQKQPPDEIVIKLLHEDSEKIVALFREHYKNRQFTQRFVYQLSSETYFALLHRFDKSLTKDVFQFLLDSFKKANAFYSDASLSTAIRKSLLKTAIEYFGTKPTAQQYIVSLVHDLLHSSSLSPDEFYKRMVSYLESIRYSRELKKYSTQEYAQTLHQLVRRSGNISINRVGSLQKKSTDVLNQSEDTYAKASLKKKLGRREKITANSSTASGPDAPSSLSSNVSEPTDNNKSGKKSVSDAPHVQKTFGSGTHAQDAQNLFASRQVLGDSTQNKPSPSAEELTLIHPPLNQGIEESENINSVEHSGSGVPANSKDEVTELGALDSQVGDDINPDTKNSAFSFKQRLEVSASSDTESIDIAEAVTESYIQNAGLVILWPYLNRFFTNLKLVDNGIFLSDEHRKRGVFILQYLTSDTPDLYEYHLLLNKILCGVPITEPLDRDLQIGKQEAELCKEFLQAVIQNWASLKNTSVPGFQEAFIRRNGVLRKGDSGWTLTVERKTYDMLMEQLPWQIGLVKLPWMHKPMMVEW